MLYNFITRLSNEEMLAFAEHARKLDIASRNSQDTSAADLGILEVINTFLGKTPRSKQDNKPFKTQVDIHINVTNLNDIVNTVAASAREEIKRSLVAAFDDAVSALR